MVNEKELRKKITAANRRIREAREEDILSLNAFKLAAQEAKKITGQKQFNRYQLSKKTLADSRKLVLLDIQLDKFLNSEWTSREGRDRIYEKRLQTFKQHHKGWDRNDILKLYDEFALDAVERLREAGIFKSDEIINFSRDYSSEQIEQATTQLASMLGEEDAEGNALLTHENALELLEGFIKHNGEVYKR